MRYAVVFTPEADDQLEALFLYIAETGSIDIAERYLTAILDTCASLAHFPNRGAPRHDIRPGLRITHHKGRTIIAYATDDDTKRVSILGVFHGGQDYEASLDPINGH